jgi:hypothetical protein
MQVIHHNRVFKVGEVVTDVARLAESLTQHTWTLCTGFQLITGPDTPPLLFLNDSFSENGAQEYAVIRNSRQIESITFSWCSRAEAHNLIVWLAQGGGGDYGAVDVHLDPAENHRCHLCR